MDDINTRVNWLSREEVVAKLHDAGMACYDDEDIDDLKEALIACIEAGDVTLD